MVFVSSVVYTDSVIFLYMLNIRLMFEVHATESRTVTCSYVDLMLEVKDLARMVTR